MGIVGKKFGRPPRWLYPMAIEIKFRAYLLSIVRMVQAETNRIFPDLSALVNEASAQQKTDAWSDDINTGFGALQVSVDKHIGADAPAKVAGEVAANISDWNDTQWRKTMKSVMGVEPFQSEPYLRDMQANFISQNVGLIKSMASDAVKRAETSIRNGITAGNRVESIKKDLKKQFGISENKARLIARDQVGKLNGDLQRARQTGVGVSRYIWRTSEDERVRANHKAMAGRLCRWDDASAYWSELSKSWIDRSGIGGVLLHPGADYQCRCYGEPYFDEIEGDVIIQENPPVQVAPPAPTVVPIQPIAPTITPVAPSVAPVVVRKKTTVPGAKIPKPPKPPKIPKPPKVVDPVKKSVDSMKAQTLSASQSPLYQTSTGGPVPIYYRHGKNFSPGKVTGFTKDMPPAFLTTSDNAISEINARAKATNLPAFRQIAPTRGACRMRTGDGFLEINFDEILRDFNAEENLKIRTVQLRKTQNSMLATVPKVKPASFAGTDAQYYARRKSMISYIRATRDDLRKEVKKGVYSDFTDWKFGDDPKKRPFNAISYFKTPGERVKKTFDHEYGHTVHQFYGVKQGISSEYQREIDKDLVPVFSRALKSGDYPSKYAATKRQEFFAENYTLHINGMDSKVNAEMLSLFKIWGL